MWRAYDGGTVEHIQQLRCHVPPVGKVPDIASGRPEQLVEVGVDGSNMPRRLQYFRHQFSLAEYNSARAVEMAKIEEDPYYVDPKLQGIRDREWKRRMNGYWFLIDGVPTYITGLHYFYLCYFHIEGTLPDYRDTDRRYFYFLQVCIEDPNCLGMLEVTKRRNGKTRRAACFLYERASRLKNHNAGIQSKTEGDARENVFKKALVTAWKMMPDFFRPVYDLSQGDSPKTSIRFYNTSRRSKKSDEPNALNSIIDYRSSDVYAYDGEKLHSLLVDECGKTEEVDVFERHNVTRLCLEVDGNFVGKAIYTTTVEELKVMKGRFASLWKTSDQGERNDNGRTISGLYRYFTPSDETMFFDDYGMPDKSAARKYIYNERSALEKAGQWDALAAFIRKHPLTIEEAFRTDVTESMFSAHLLNERMDVLQFHDNLTIRGNLRWKDGNRDSEVEFREEPNGRWEFSWLPEDASLLNRVRRSVGISAPDNNALFALGVDPYDHNYTKDKYKSKGAILVYGKPNPFEPDVSERFVCKYHARPSRVESFYEDVLLTCVFFGAEALVEDNKTGLVNYMEARGYHKFLAWMPNASKPGISATTQSHQAIAERWEDYIEKHHSRISYVDLVRELLTFDLANTRKFDLVMAGGYALLLAYSKQLRQEIAEKRNTGAVYFKPKNR